MKNEKFSKQDRDLVIKTLETMQGTTFLAIKPSQKFFVDKKQNYYCIFGGREDWHGITQDLMTKIEQFADRTLLVIVKKYQTRLDVCVASAEQLIASKNQLRRTKQDGFQFHTILTADGLYVEEIPALYFKKIKEIPIVSVIGETFNFTEIKKIINVDLLIDVQIEDEDITHSDIEAKIILIGNWLGHRTFTPDTGKSSRYGILGDLSSEKRMPTEYIAERLINKVNQIDVIWFDQEGYPTHCFEIEHTTDITKGLLRLYQIRKLGVKMFILAKENFHKKFQTEVNKDPFFHIKEEYIFRTYKDLQAFFESAKKFAITKGMFLSEGD